MTDPNSSMDFEDISDLDEQYVLNQTSGDIALRNSTDHHIICEHMVNQTRRNIRIFTRDLDPVIFDHEDFTQACKKLALRSRYSRIEILAFESRKIIRRGHRLVDLARALSSRIEIRRPEKQYEKNIQAFITLDESGYVYRNQADRFEGVANYNDARETRALNKFFEEIWNRSHVDSEMRRLNI